MDVSRCSYIIPVNQVKSNGEKLNSKDYFDMGYMAGRFGINLNGNPNEHSNPIFTTDNVQFDINFCTCSLLEENLNQAGIKFDVLV